MVDEGNEPHTHIPPTVPILPSDFIIYTYPTLSMPASLLSATETTSSDYPYHTYPTHPMPVPSVTSSKDREDEGDPHTMTVWVTQTQTFTNTLYKLVTSDGAGNDENCLGGQDNVAASAIR